MDEIPKITIEMTTREKIDAFLDCVTDAELMARIYKYIMWVTIYE